MDLSPKSVKTILKSPERAIEDLTDLVYVKDEDLTIYRKKEEKGFYYLLENNRIRDKKLLKRFNDLVIPPAWNKVRIAPLSNAHLQAVGRDAKGRKVYKYHPKWQQLRNETKFMKMAAFGKALPLIRKKVDKDLDQEEMTKTKVLALILRLMEETHIRIGSSYYKEKNETYGLSTLRSRHLNTYEDCIMFHFTGKSGKEHTVQVKDEKLVNLVMQCEEIPGWEIFKYYDAEGEKHTVDSGLVNAYLQEISNELFSAKDFRTWSATKIFFEQLYNAGYVSEEREKEKLVLDAYDKAAESLGNTRRICRQYYVHPAIENSYMEGSIQEYFKQLQKGNLKKQEGFSATERAILEIIKEYNPMEEPKS